MKVKAERRERRTCWASAFIHGGQSSWRALKSRSHVWRCEPGYERARSWSDRRTAPAQRGGTRGWRNSRENRTSPTATTRRYPTSAPPVLPPSSPAQGELATRAFQTNKRNVRFFPMWRKLPLCINAVSFYFCLFLKKAGKPLASFVVRCTYITPLLCIHGKVDKEEGETFIFPFL